MKTIHILNTESGEKERFTPLSKSDTVKMYSCGPTVYNPPHIGNMRAYIVTDTLRRILTRAGYTPTCIINITDVGHLISDSDEGEDKIEEQAKKEKKSVDDIVSKNTNLFMNDLTHLNIPTDRYTFPRATEYIKEQIAHIQKLEEDGYTYRIEDGIYFDTSRFARYGALGQLESIKPGARVKVAGGKKNDSDFALWKFSPKDEKRQQEWKSPWGVGFPGWHMECSTMAITLLGEQIDIHTGGIDHIPIHHNNEIAQSESITGKRFSKYWLHTAFLTIDEEKISKSIGNTYTINDLIKKGYHSLSFRYFCLLTLYRTPLSFSFEALDAAQTALDTLHKINNLWDIRNDSDYKPDKKELQTPCKKTIKECEDALFDNFNTPKAIGCLWKTLNDATVPIEVKQNTLRDIDSVLGLHLIPHSPPTDDILAMARNRNRERIQRRWKEADALRDDIKKAGYLCEDTDETTYLYPII